MADSGVMAKPAKYENLRRAEAIGLIIPHTLLLDEAAASDVVQGFVEQAEEGARFIVRSAYSDEDGTAQSYAGHFWSSEAVSISQLFEMIDQGWRENLRISENLPVVGEMYLIVQEYIEHEVGGVLFAPWSFYPDYACVEYSLGGVQDVVSGVAETAIIALVSDAESPLPLKQDTDFLSAELLTACQALRTAFDFTIDCEWAWSTRAQQLVVLQVRPQTHAIGPVLAFPENAKHILPEGEWGYTALSESLGRLSPLSFSLLQQLYQDLLPTLRRLGCVAADAGFMCRMPDGTVLVDEECEQQLYAPTRFGGFWRGLRAEKLRQQAIKVFELPELSGGTDSFSYETLSQVFSSWMVSNFLSAGAGRLQQNTPHAYELSWQSVYPAELVNTGDNDWSVLNERGKRVFMSELGKLKRELAQHPQRVFCGWQAYQSGDYSAAESEQQLTAAEAIYDYASIVQGGESYSGGLSLAANHRVIAEVFVVQQPGQHHGRLPDGCILVAPYFDNCWVADIGRLQGIVVQRGGHLSHSVIVARELGVPYCVLPELDIAALVSGAEYSFDPLRKKLAVR